MHHIHTQYRYSVASKYLKLSEIYNTAVYIPHYFLHFKNAHSSYYARLDPGKLSRFHCQRSVDSKFARPKTP